MVAGDAGNYGDLTLLPGVAVAGGGRLAVLLRGPGGLFRLGGRRVGFGLAGGGAAGLAPNAAGSPAE
ncbi:MAG TPA: hypothetical protein VH136_16225 [Trebonia sp.]|nr:hypothetical protein [Trebonia sp.]